MPDTIHKKEKIKKRISTFRFLPSEFDKMDEIVHINPEEYQNRTDVLRKGLKQLHIKEVIENDIIRDS